MDRIALSELLLEMYNENTCGSVAALSDHEELATDLGLDSIDMVSLVMQVERYFRIRLSHEELNSVATVGNLLDLITVKLPQQSLRRAA